MLSGGVVTLGGGVLNCWAKKQKSVALSSWESELFAAITSDTRSLGIQSELMDLGYNCSVTVATDSQSVIDHSRRRGHSVASKHVGLRGLWLQEALENRKLELEKVDTATNPADVCAKALPRDRIRELCRPARVYVCCSEGADRKEVIRIMSGIPKGILAKCIDAREEEQDSSCKSDLEVGQKAMGETDDSSKVGADVPLRRAEVRVDKAPPPPREGTT